MIMEIRETFCPKCGGPSDGGLCGKCRAEMTEWLVCDNRIEFVRCPSCGSLKHGNTWTDVQKDEDELAAELALGAVHLHEDVKNARITLDTQNPSPNRTVCNMHVEGTLYGTQVREDCRIEIVWKKEQCDRCTRLSGGYYAGILQVRATNRKPDPFEIDRAAAIAYQIEEQLQEGGERLSFVSQVDEIKDGLDIIVSSHHIGELISREIVRSLGGRVTKHPKLVGEKDGRKLFRITYSIRLPCYQRGDVVRFDRKFYEIRDVDAHGMRVFDLKSGESRVMREDCSGVVLGNVRDADEALVAYLKDDVAGIMDPETYMTVEYRVLPWLSLTEGEYVRVLRDRDTDRLVLVG